MLTDGFYVTWHLNGKARTVGVQLLLISKFQSLLQKQFNHLNSRGHYTHHLLQESLHFASTLYLYASCDSFNRRRLLPVYNTKPLVFLMKINRFVRDMK